MQRGTIMSIMLGAAVASASAGRPGVEPRSPGYDLPELETPTVELGMQLADALQPDKVHWVYEVHGGLMLWEGGGDALVVLDPAGRAWLHETAEPITSGVVWNPGPRPVWVSFGNGWEPFELGANDVAVVGLQSPAGTAAIARLGYCRVFCADGYYACCNYGADGLPRCTCQQMSRKVACDSGGQGATECETVQVGSRPKGTPRP